MRTLTSLPSLQLLYGQPDNLLDDADDLKPSPFPSQARTHGRGRVCYTYVHPNSYRQAYRFLNDWQQKWGNYERRHQSDDSGLPFDPDEPPMVSLESLMATGFDVADLRDALEGVEISDLAMRLTRSKEGKLEKLLRKIFAVE